LESEKENLAPKKYLLKWYNKRRVMGG
jgi:hypothetical protein